MIKENQRLLNQINVVTDGFITYFMLPLAYWLRFYVLPNGQINVPLQQYLRIDLLFTLVQLFTFASFGLYQSFRTVKLRRELTRLLNASLLDLALLLSWLFIGHNEHYSRWTLAIYFLLSVSALVIKRTVLREMLHRLRKSGRNKKHILIIGSGESAKKYLNEIAKDQELGYNPVGYIARKTGVGFNIPYLGGYEALEKIFERIHLDEVVSAIDTSDYELTPHIINSCESAGVKLSIIPFYADYMPAHPQFDDLNGIPLLNIRRIPLDNFANAFMKRAMDIFGSLSILIIGAPVILICAMGVKISSPGPVLFKQVRVGRNRKEFVMLKFRSMCINDSSTSAWSTDVDPRRTRFGSILRKLSMDELIQAVNVLKGDMSLVGPRPEIPYYVDQFKDEVPLYMIRHQVRPGITGWAQINGLRGDTPIKERVEHDIYYIENWSIWFDIQILFATVFRGKFINDEKI